MSAALPLSNRKITGQLQDTDTFQKFFRKPIQFKSKNVTCITFGPRPPKAFGFDETRAAS
jgi:hypothetical protein